jgi:predicted kinase
MENRGNEAKKYLKTKEVTVFSAANSACLARKSARIRRKMEHVQRILRKTNLRFECKAEA